jgi:scyllo-inositol 2-dehydrogenase (NADP+)
VTDRLRVAVVGLGWVATHRHLPWLRRNPDVTVAGVVDRNPDRAEATAKQFHVTSWAGASGSPADVSWLDSVDAVSIAAPPRAHHALARAWLEAGRHVLLEKPMAMAPGEAADLEQLAAAAGRTLAVVHNFQFARSVLRARALLASGRLGELVGLSAVQLSSPRRRLPAWYEDLPLGLFYDESPHFMYLVQAITGTPARLLDARVVASTAGRNTPHRVTAAMESGGVPIQLDMMFEAPISEWHLAVLGSEATAVVDVFRDILVVLPSDGAHGARDILRTSSAAIRGHVWGTFASGVRLFSGRLPYGNDEVIRRFVQAVRTGASPDGISAADGRRVVELQHAVLDHS